MKVRIDIYLFVLCMLFLHTDSDAQYKSNSVSLDWRAKNSFQNNFQVTRETTLAWQNILEVARTKNLPEFFRKYSRNYYFNYANHQYDYTSLVVVDTMLKLFSKYGLAMSEQPSLNKTTELGKIISEIQQLPNDTASYNLNVTYFSNRISELSDPVEKIYAIFLFGRYFSVNQPPMFEGNLLNQCYEICDNEKNAISKAKCYISIGDYMPQDYTPIVFSQYMQALYICDSLEDFNLLARIEDKIASLFSTKANYFFQSKAYYHNVQSLNLFYKSHDTVNLTIKFNTLAAKEFFDNNEDTFITNNALLASAYLYYLVILGSKDSGLHSHLYNYALPNSLGMYFARRLDTSDRITAQIFYVAALATAMNDLKTYHRGNVFNAIANLAKFRSSLGDTVNSLKYIDSAISFASRLHDIDLQKSLELQKAEVLFNLKMYNDAILTAQRAINTTSIQGLSNNTFHSLLINTYLFLRTTYDSIGNMDSSMFYHNKYLAESNNDMNEAISITQIETIWASKLYERKIRNKEIENERNRLALIVGICSLIVLSVSIIIYRNRLHTIQLKEKEEELNALAKEKMHNIRKLFTNVFILLQNKDYERAEIYADSAGYLLTFSYKNWSWKKNDWTIRNEQKLVEAYYETERILGKKVNLIYAFDDIDIYRTRFIPEALITLLNNSIRHGFKDPDREYYFKVAMKVKDNMLYCIVSDNGTPSKYEAYNNSTKTDSGLNYLKQRIKNILRISHKNKYVKDSFKLDLEKGTTIKMILPYVTTT